MYHTISELPSMKALLLTLLSSTLLITSLIAQECNICKVMIPVFQRQYNAAAYDSIYATLAPQFQKELPAEASKEFFSSIHQQVGNLNGTRFIGYSPHFARYAGDFDSTILELNFSIDNANQFDGLQVKEYDSLKTVERNKAKIGLPFKGEWYINAGGDTKEQNPFHISALAQRRAFDIVIRDKNGRSYRTNGEKNEDYYAFGQPLYAPCAGVVVEAIDGLKDNVPGEMNKMYIPGNTVVIKAADSEYVFLCHFRQGSIKVKGGQKVVKGDLLGQCGNSGNSSEPHLHYHLQDGPDINTAIGKKMYFDRLKVNDIQKQDYSPVKAERISPE
jgi:murein DD-endopeptidase MepM/ murein hydrolase activator NlpD